jgi:hypothetical protein
LFTLSARSIFRLLIHERIRVVGVLINTLQIRTSSSH